MAKIQLDAVLKLIDVQINPQVFRKISQAVAGLPANINKTNKGLKQTSAHAKNLNRNLNKTGTILSGNEKAARLFLRRMAQFAILLPIFSTLNRAIQGSVKFLFEFDGALRDIVRIDISGLKDRMEEVGDAALDTAVKFGVTGTEVLGVTRIFKQAGFTIEESQAKAQAAILATQISTLNSAQATEVFIAAQKQFGAEGENAISVLDKLAKVEDLAAVNASDVAEAFRSGGNALAFFAKSIDDSIGLIAALREQTRKSGREIGTFLKTIQTRIFAAGDARSSLEALGVTVENLDGSLRPTLDVFNDLKTAFDGLTEAQVANAAKSIAGIRQFESLIATLQSLDRANELSASSANAAGTAEEKRLITDAKLERQLGKLVAQGQKFAEALGDAGLEDSLAKALKIATDLLETFTGMTDVVSKLGGSLSPLLALGGVSLAKGVFGLAGGGAAAGAAGVAGAAALGGVGGGKESKALGKNTKSIKSNTRARFKATVAANKGVIGFAAATVGAIALSSAFNAAANRVEDAGDKNAAAGLRTAGAGLSLAAQFATMGKKASAAAFAIGAVTNAWIVIADAFAERTKDIKGIKDEEARGGRINKGELLLLGSNDKSQEAQQIFIENFIKHVADAKPGIELGKAIQASLAGTAASGAFKEIGLSAQEFSESLFSNVAAIRNVIKNNDVYLRGLAESGGRLDEFNDLLQALEDRSVSAGNAINLLARATANVGDAAKEGQTRADLIAGLDVKDFNAVQKVGELSDSVRILGQELQIAQLGPDAFVDSVSELQNRLLLAEVASDKLTRSLDDSLSKELQKISELPGLATLGVSSSEFFNTINAAVQSLDIKKIQEFERFILELPAAEQKAAAGLLQVMEERVQAEIDIQEKRNDLQAAQNAKAKAMLDAETSAANNAFAATQRFTAELVAFGDTVNKDVLSSFQDVSAGDVESVLAGTSDLEQGVQELIRNAFGDSITEAQSRVQATAAKSSAEMNILARSLEMVESKLMDQANAADIASLTAEKLAIELSIEENQQDAVIDATKGKIKVLKAERDAAEKAAVAEKKRLDLLEKLKDASRAFSKELATVQREFQEFSQQKIADLLGQEADARSELKDTQQEVLSSTQSLAESYDALIQAQLVYNGTLADARIQSGFLARDIDFLTGAVVTFDNELASLGDVFNDVLNDSNLSLSKRIDLERQLAEETSAFLQQARDSIVNAGLGVFGQDAAQSQALGQGIQGLQFVADQLGGSFEAFLSLTQGELSDVTANLLSLPAEFRQQILDALSFLPSTTNIGGFNVDQLTQAIGQIGAGVDADSGLPSIEELNNEQVQQLQRLQELALQDAQLQFSQVLAAEEQLAAAEEAAEAAKLLEERSSQNLMDVRDAVLEEKAVLDTANAERRELLDAVVAADDKNTLLQIEKQAQAFADQNATFRDVGDSIVRGISSAIGARLSVLDALANVNNAANGFMPNFASGNLSPGEAASLLRAGAREKRAMPGGAGLAVANTSEAIIPMRAGGFIPNFQEGSQISAGISAVKGVNETVVAAIARSVTTALTDIRGGEGNTDDLLTEVVSQLSVLNSSTDDLNASNATVAANTQVAAAGGGTATTTGTAQSVDITIQTNQNNTVSVTGLESLRSEITEAVRDAASQQVDAQLETLLNELDQIFIALQERGILSSFGQTR